MPHGGQSDDRPCTNHTSRLHPVINLSRCGYQLTLHSGVICLALSALHQHYQPLDQRVQSLNVF